jgi:GNAT superfamily N-acetyltransferase
MIVEARSPAQVEQVRALFVEYGQSLGFSLCFQDFDAELASLPRPYVAPRGALFLAVEDGAPAGCVGLRGIEPGVGEMKRLYVKPGFRGRGLGKQLTHRVLDEARRAGHARLRLDTVPVMKTAQAMYEHLGFVDIPAYTANPVEGARFMELRLTR